MPPLAWTRVRRLSASETMKNTSSPRKKSVEKSSAQHSASPSKPPSSRPLEVYDTTLRDGAQAEDVSFSAEDKVRVAQKLDELGVHYIEEDGRGRTRKILSSSG